MHPLGIKVIFKFQSCLRNILIKNSPENDNNIVYKIPCLNCNGIYLGQTSKDLETRVKQHKSNVRSFSQNSALFKHSFDNDLIINWEESCKIINNGNWLERNIIESFMIEFNKNNFNISKSLYSFDPLIFSFLKADLRYLSN